MPTDTIQIGRVEKLPLKRGKQLHRYLVYPERAEDSRGWSPWYETLDPWKASVCRQAAKLKQPVLMGWHESKVYGYVIDSVTLLEAPATGDKSVTQASEDGLPANGASVRASRVGRAVETSATLQKGGA